MNRRVVITGLGSVNPLGNSVLLSWNRLLESKSGIVRNERFSTDQLTSKVAGLCNPAVPDDDRLFSPAVNYALEAAKEAISDSSLELDQTNLESVGVCVGSGIGNIDEIYKTSTIVNESVIHIINWKGIRKISPFFVPKVLINQAAGAISCKYGFKGPNHSVGTACTTGAHAIGDAMRFIQYGDADIMIAGGTEAAICPLAIAAFGKARSLSTKFNDHPEAASRPFDKDRDGFVISEGAGIMVLEEYEHAKRRGAEIYAEIIGYGLSGDAYHATAPCPDGDGAYRCMKRALQVANIRPDEIDYINAHATSTVLGDLAETRAIKRLYGDKASVMISSTKGALGHLLGAAGAVEAIFTVLSVFSQSVPPTLNLINPGDEFDLDYVPLTARHLKHSLRRSGVGLGIQYGLTNSFGFGGTNASLIFKRI